MLAAQSTTLDPESIKTVILLLAVALVVFWRTAIRLVIMVLAVGVIALLGSGAFVLVQSMHHVVK